MAYTVSDIRKDVLGAHRLVLAQIDITSYTALGEALSASDFGLARIEFISAAASENGYMVSWDGSKTAPKLLAFEEAAVASAPLTDADAADDIGTIEVMVLGK